LDTSNPTEDAFVHQIRKGFAASASQKPPLQSTDEQCRKIQDALVTAHSAQKTPDKFEAKVGAKVPTQLKLDTMPQSLAHDEPVLKQYDFVKLNNDLLVVDPMNSTVVAIIPRKFPKDHAATQRPKRPDSRSGVAR
jgi:Protein of unknown function (DUF1236)